MTTPTLETTTSEAPSEEVSRLRAEIDILYKVISYQKSKIESLSTGKKKSTPSSSPRRGPAPTAVCGSCSAYQRHLRHGEEACDLCRKAWRDYQTAYRNRKKNADTTSSPQSESPGDCSTPA
jgi:hypothetical protein